MSEEKQRINRVLTTEQLIVKKFKPMQFTDKWRKSLGEPEITGTWIIWGGSGNGKTRFAIQLSKYLSKFGKVAYNSMEEGVSRSLQRVIIEEEMVTVKNRFVVLNREHIKDLKTRLRKQRSPDIIIIDSYQYIGLTKPDYIKFKEEFSNKLLIFISHADGKHPEGRAAKFVRFDADIKIYIEGFKAFPTSRFGGDESYTIWHEGAEKYWGNKEFN